VGTEKRQRQKANRARRQAEESRAAKSDAVKRNAVRWVLVLLAAIAGVVLIAWIGGAFSSDDDGGKKASAGAAGASLAAAGTTLLPPPAGGLKPLVGKTAKADDVVVQSVVQNADNPDALEGFWVGSSKTDRVYVEWGGDVGTDESDFRPKVGQHVRLTGPVRPAPADPARTLSLDADDATLVRSQGGYVNADEVRAAG